MATLPLKYPLTVYRATAFDRVFRWSPDGTNPQDFTGWTASLYISWPDRTRTPLLTLASGDGITLTSDGEVIVSISTARTHALQRGVYLYNLDLVDPSAKPIRFMRGRLDVVQDAGPA